MQKTLKLPKGFLFLLLLSLLIFIGCDDNSSNSIPVSTGAPPGLDCLDASSNSNIIEESIDCPADAVVNICTGFVCDTDTPGQGEPVTRSSNLFFAPSNCEASGCFDFRCDSSMFVEDFTFGEYAIDTVSGNVITGTVLLTDENTNETTNETTELNFACSPLVI